MNFEHLIAINEPGNPLLVSLTRSEIWSGLLHRVDNPLPFLPGLEKCTVLENTEAGILRRLDFGQAAIHDRVTLAAEEWVCFTIQPSDNHAGGSLTIRIEEPEPGHLFLRFAYQTTLGNSGNAEERAYIDYVKSAYHQSDIDCVRIIRTLAAGGQAH